MTNQTQKKQIAAAVTGVIVGAGAVVAGAIALNDKKNRDKIATAVTNVNDQAQEKMDKAENKVKKVLA